MKLPRLISIITCTQVLLVSSEQSFADYYRNLLKQDPTNFGHVYNLSNAFNQEEKNEAALYLYQYILTHNPSHVSARYNCAFMLKKMGKPAQALPLYQEVLLKQPQNWQAHFGYAQALLMTGNLKEGFAHLEWRNHDRKHRFEGARTLKHDIQTNPDALRNKKIFIWAEYGSGDVFQFIRYLKLLKSYGAYIIMHTYPPLIPLLNHHQYIDEMVPVGSMNIPKFDYQLAFMSLPYLFDLTLETIPNDAPYLKPDPELKNYWHEQLKHDHNFKIGVCCEKKGNDVERSPLSRRTFSLSTFKQLSETPGISVYCLQRMDDIDVKNAPKAIHFFDSAFDKKNGGFSDCIAVMTQLDLIISVDTSVAHLAGALGVPVWVPLPIVADWRWMLQRTDSPWYPTMRLFRQKNVGDWQDVIEEIMQNIQELMKQ